MRRIDDLPNRASSTFRVPALDVQSSNGGIRLPAPSGSIRLVFHKRRNSRLGIGPTDVAPPIAIDVERYQSELGALYRLNLIADPRCWFSAVRIRRLRVLKFSHRKDGSPAQTSPLQQEAEPSRPARRLQTVSVSKRDLYLSVCAGLLCAFQVAEATLV